jgi:Tol biopolymer transport system component
VINVADAAASRLTFTAGSAPSPVWAADGRVLYQLSTGRGGAAVYARNANGAGSEDLIGSLESNEPRAASRSAYVWDTSRDGQFLVYSIIGRQGAADLWVLPLDGDRKPYPFAESPFHKTQAQISPNGRWIAYTSYDSGKDEVYVQSFPSPGSRRQISTGGMQPRWRRDGRELFYLGSDQSIHVLPVQTDGPFQAGNPTALFRARILPQGSQSIWFETAYDVSPDGQRLLFAVPPDDAGPPMTVVLNWPAVMKR